MQLSVDTISEDPDILLTAAHYEKSEMKFLLLKSTLIKQKSHDSSSADIVKKQWFVLSSILIITIIIVNFLQYKVK